MRTPWSDEAEKGDSPREKVLFSFFNDGEHFGWSLLQSSLPSDCMTQTATQEV